jgi:hypothetical protein
VTVDTSKRRIVSILHPAPAVNARQISRNDKIEAFANLEMKPSAPRQMAAIAVVVVLFESITSDPGTGRRDHENGQ